MSPARVPPGSAVPCCARPHSRCMSKSAASRCLPATFTSASSTCSTPCICCKYGEGGGGAVAELASSRLGEGGAWLGACSTRGSYACSRRIPPAPHPRHTHHPASGVITAPQYLLYREFVAIRVQRGRGAARQPPHRPLEAVPKNQGVLRRPGVDVVCGFGGMGREWCSVWETWRQRGHRGRLQGRRRRRAGAGGRRRLERARGERTERPTEIPEHARCLREAAGGLQTTEGDQTLQF